MSHIELKILYFAAAREKVGQSEEILTFEKPMTLAEVKQYLFSIYSDLEKIAPYLRWAINQSFQDDESLSLSTGDEIAIIPPISGG